MSESKERRPSPADVVQKIGDLISPTKSGLDAAQLNMVRRAVLDNLATDYPNAVIELKTSEMNLYANPEVTVAYLIAMEGVDWFNQQKRNLNRYTIDNALALAKETNSPQVIYGAGGMRRYLVSPEGKVSFDQNSTTSEAWQAKAQKLGF